MQDYIDMFNKSNTYPSIREYKNVRSQISPTHYMLIYDVIELRVIGCDKLMMCDFLKEIPSYKKKLSHEVRLSLKHRNKNLTINIIVMVN